MSLPESLTLLQVDAFTDRPFGGNPAAVCVLPEPADADWMQAVAAEMNLPETAFLYPITDGSMAYHLRWFSPTIEVNLCGHATLASAHVLWSEGHLAPDQAARFTSRGGSLTATKQGDWITLNFSAETVTATPADPVLIDCLGGVEPVFVGQNLGAPNPNYLVELASEEQVRSLQPDFALMKTLPMMGVIVTSRGDDPAVDFVSRYFVPSVGVDEDPVTGSAHCALTPYWQAKLGKTDLLAHQISARGGVLKVSSEGDRVFISGQAVTVLKGQLQTDQ
jgi:PhzF family phenazine biosynthesis protein